MCYTMKRLIPILLLAISSTPAIAQDYACVLPADTQYYINGNNYLRGMRIDSTAISGDTTFYYPFKTPRYSSYPKLDFNGGSWMGSKILKLKDGTYWFINHWSDTVMIKSQAELNDKWMLYQEDTSGIYYEAEITAIDTMTLLGVVDSVKTITITGYNKSRIISTISGLTFLLSKKNGFVAIHDIYFFPYHHPGDDSNFFDVMVGDYYSFIVQSFPKFSLIDLNNPLRSEMFQYNVGDIFFTVDKPQSWNGTDDIYFYDSVIAVNIIPNGREYVIHRTSHSPVYPPPGPPPRIVTYDTSYSTYTIKADSTPFITEFPEESGNEYIYYYYPNDTSYCTANDLFGVDIDQIIGDVVHHSTDVVTSTQKFKVGVGRVYYDIYRVLHPRGFSFRRYLEYYRIGGIDCGQYYFPLTTSNIAKATSGINIYPNPVSGNTVYIDVPSGGLYEMTVYDIVGKEVGKAHLNGSYSLDVSGYTSGLYLFVIKGADGSIHQEKVSVL